MGTRTGSKTVRGDKGDRLVNEIRAVCDGVRDRLCRVVQGRRPGQASADLADAVLEDVVWLRVQQRIGAKRG